MKFKKTIIASVAALALTGFITGCGDEKKAAAPAPKDSKAVTLKVGVSPVPHAEILGAVKDKLAKEGVNVEIIEFTDYVQPNLALNDKNLDANYFQHKPYLDEFARSRNLKLVSAGAIHLEPMSVFSKKIKDLKDLPDGAPITATPQDITENKKNLQFSELEAPQLPRSLEDADISIININFALEAKLNPKDAIFTESGDSPYANIVAVREGDENRPEIKKLIEALTGKESKDFIEKKYNGAIKTAF